MAAAFFISPSLDEIEREFFSDLRGEIPRNSDGSWDGFHEDEAPAEQTNWEDWKQTLIKKYGR